MVQVVEVYDYAFIGKFKYDQRRVLAASVDSTEQTSRDNDSILEEMKA